MPENPYILTFDSIGSPAEGFVTTTQHAHKLPFAVKRVFWTHGTPPAVVRGGHAHKQTAQVLVAVQGQVKAVVDNGSGQQCFLLQAPDKGLYLPPLHWVDLYFEEGALLLCLASTDFEEADYVRSHVLFRHAAQKNLEV